MAQADCVVLTLADTAAIRAGLLIPASLAVLRDKTVIQMGNHRSGREPDSAGRDRTSRRIVLQGAGAGVPCRSTVYPVGSVGRFTESEATSGRSRREGRVPETRAQSIDCCRNISFRSEPWVGAAGRGSHRHLHGDLAGERIVRPGVREEAAATPAAYYQNPNFATRHLLKDVELFLGEASGYALTASSLEWFRPVLERTIAQGLGDSDYSAIFEVVNPIPSP